jgi:hypothetical protein
MSDHAFNALFALSLVTLFGLLAVAAVNTYVTAHCTRRILRAIENSRDNPKNEPPQSK